jgi:hypothetical protein
LQQKARFRLFFKRRRAFLPEFCRKALRGGVAYQLQIEKGCRKDDLTAAQNYF